MTAREMAQRMLDLHTFNIKAADLSDKKSKDVYQKMAGPDGNDGGKKKKGKQGKTAPEAQVDHDAVTKSFTKESAQAAKKQSEMFRKID